VRSLAGRAQSYAEFRPEYPAALYDFLLQLVPSRELAWDCGTGIGQAAHVLARHFVRVVVTETPRQFARASVDLVTVAQAAHWFETGSFYEAASAALRPNGIIAIWGYGFCSISPEIDAILHPYGREFLTPYWSERSTIALEGYRQLPFPFARVATPHFQMTTTWSLPQLRGYLDSWSATQAYKVRVGRDPFEAIEASLISAWGDPTRSHQIAWDLTVLIGRNRSGDP